MKCIHHGTELDTAGQCSECNKGNPAFVLPAHPEMKFGLPVPNFNEEIKGLMQHLHETMCRIEVLQAKPKPDADLDAKVSAHVARSLWAHCNRLNHLEADGIAISEFMDSRKGKPNAEYLDLERRLASLELRLK